MTERNTIIRLSIIVDPNGNIEDVERREVAYRLFNTLKRDTVESKSVDLNRIEVDFIKTPETITSLSEVATRILTTINQRYEIKLQSDSKEKILEAGASQDVIKEQIQSFISTLPGKPIVGLPDSYEFPNHQKEPKKPGKGEGKSNA